MQPQPSRRSSLFLLELIIAIMFFILASTVCVRLFVKSHTLENKSTEQNHAINSAVSIAEVFRNQSDPVLFLQNQFPLGSKNTSDFSIYYDNDWLPCSSSESQYISRIHIEYEGNFSIGHINIYKGNHVLYSLIVKKYIPKEVSL